MTDPETGRTIGCRDFQYAYGCAPATGEAGLTGIAARAVLLDGCGRPVRKGPLHLLRDWRARTLNVRRREGILRGADSLRPRTAAAAGVHGIPRPPEVGGGLILGSRGKCYNDTTHT